MDFVELKQVTKAGVRQTLESLPPDLVGYALCTDDDLSTLFHVGCTA